ncbi:hypothetical protein ACOCGS_003475 [Vibrio cholerae]|uniref:hypothetical protein n=1 Tax=Vibrio cholerae TaxID=666 RepID=UPI000E0BBA3F|nr:hypothetical protein [Vibrio cholerae]EJL6600995.1 hypothetical protein [Vibrio cholerae]ELG4778533.1 hypothetical protein [Vibrio cholerae]ELK8295910.1 hypothetical protein [Vibrio cholerae]
MLKLKENCTKLNFQNMVKSDEAIKLIMYGVSSEEYYKSEIKHLTECCRVTPEYTDDFKLEIGEYQSILNDPNYLKGIYPRGLEEIIQQIVEPMSLWEAITSLSTDHFLASENYFRSLVDVSVTFLLSCEIAKLFNDKPGDFSLSNVWKYSRERVVLSGVACAEEVAFIDIQFDLRSELRDKRIKRLLQFRNKQIAHNDASEETIKDDFTYTTYFVLRVWAILDALYSPDCYPRPILMDEHLFDQFYKIMTNDELAHVKRERLKFINELLSSCSKDLVTGKCDGKLPFAQLNITIKIT